MRILKIKTKHSGREQTLAVNNEFEGAFVKSESGSWQQIAGCGEFFAKSPEAFMRKYRSMFIGEYDEPVTMVRGSAQYWG